VLQRSCSVLQSVTVCVAVCWSNFQALLLSSDTDNLCCSVLKRSVF